MRITQIDTHLLRLPLARPVTLPAGGERGIDHVNVLLVQLDTDAGHRGLGFTYVLGAGSRALKTLVDDDLAPLVTGEDPLDHERLGRKALNHLSGIDRHGLAGRAYSAIDLALWDLKGKAAGLPLYKLLGGARESTPAFAADAAWLWMSPEEIIDASRPLLDQGFIGIQMRVGGNPQADADRVTRVREALGEDIWFGIDADQRYDYTTALAIGHFFEEEIGADWFENPIPADDIDGHRQLASRLELPLAVGGTLDRISDLMNYLSHDAVGVLRPDPGRLGGLTNFLKVATIAEAHHLPIVPHVVPEIGVHLGCGLPNVRAVEHAPWLHGLFIDPPPLLNGQLAPPKRPGLGLELRPDAFEKYRVTG